MYTPKNEFVSIYMPLVIIIANVCYIRFSTRVRSTMKTSTVLCAAVVVLVHTLYVSAAGGERPQQQLPLFFQASRPFNAPGAPLPKFVGVAGNQQPQAFRSLPPQVDEDQDDDEQQHNEDEPHQRNVLAPTPLPFRPQPTQQQVSLTH